MFLANLYINTEPISLGHQAVVPPMTNHNNKFNLYIHFYRKHINISICITIHTVPYLKKLPPGATYKKKEKNISIFCRPSFKYGPVWLYI
jgi:hypothetical protein